MNIKILTSLTILALCSMNASYAFSNYSYQQTYTQPSYGNNYVQQPLQYNNGQPLQGSVVMVPAGTNLPAMLTSPISSETACTGQTVSLALNSDFYYNNKLIAPAGSTVYGTVIEASKAKHGSINGRLCIRFSQIFTPYGTQIPISAVIKTDDSSGVLVGGTKMDVTKEYAKDIVAGSASGALSGLVFGALAGGNIGRGTALGTAVGAGSGLAKSIWDKGADVQIPANSIIEIMLMQPITTTAANYSYED